MKLKDLELTPNELFLSLHGTLMALITSLHRAGQLPQQEFLEQMVNSEKSLYEEHEPFAGHLIASYRAALAVDLKNEASSS